MMDTLTVKRGDKHDVRLTIGNPPMDLTGGAVAVHVKPSSGAAAAQVFPATIDGENVVTWSMDGTIAVGKYKLEVQVTLGGFIVTAPSDGNMQLVVLQDLA